jgi:hypothetical protein
MRTYPLLWKDGCEAKNHAGKRVFLVFGNAKSANVLLLKTKQEPLDLLFTASPSIVHGVEAMAHDCKMLLALLPYLRDGEHEVTCVICDAGGDGQSVSQAAFFPVIFGSVHDGRFREYTTPTSNNSWSTRSANRWRSMVIISNPIAQS